MTITNKLTMELTKNCSSPIIYAVQDDKYSRNLELSLLENGKPWIIPENTLIVIRYLKSDGKGGEYNTLPDESSAWSAEENILHLTLAPQVLTTPGVVSLSITMMMDLKQLTTFTILIKVDTAVRSMHMESEEYFHVPGFLPVPRDAEAGHFLQVSAVDSAGHVTGIKTTALMENTTAVVEPEEKDIPKVFFGSALPQTKDDTIMPFRYISKTGDISGYCKTTAQGSSSMSYPKKNQTVKLYKDAECTEKLKVDFKGWGKQNKFCFKANWVDHSHARNIIGAKLWDSVVSSRPDHNELPSEMRNSPHNGAIDGFPVKLYADGVYQGIYTLNIPKDAWMFNMDESNPNHVLLCAERNNNGEEVDTSCNFRTFWNSDNAWEWKVEVGERTDAIASSFNALISCVKDTDDATFRNTIGNHLDVQSAIDYWIHQYIICGLDSLGKNMLMATYDGVKWICGAYDMDSTFGLYIDGSKFVSTGYKCPEDYQENRSLLWERISTVFADEVAARYAELREDVYNYANLFNHFERFMDVIGSELYAEDVSVFPNIPNASTNNIQQIRAYIKDRLYYTDIQFGLIEEPEQEKIVIATDFVQSASDTATTFELYNGPTDWNTQGLVMELAVEHTNADGDMFFVGENLNTHDDDFLFKVWYWDNAQYMDAYIQSGDVNGEWKQCLVSKMSDYIADWSNIKIEINKNGIFVNGNDVADKANDPSVYELLFDRLMSKTTLQIGKKNTNKLHPATFKSVYFYTLDNSSTKT